MRANVTLCLGNLQVVNKFDDGEERFAHDWMRHNERDMASLAWEMAAVRERRGFGSINKRLNDNTGNNNKDVTRNKMNQTPNLTNFKMNKKEVIRPELCISDDESSSSLDALVAALLHSSDVRIIILPFFH